MRAILWVALAAGRAAAVQLGYEPATYQTGDKVDLLVNKVESDHTQLPYGYYDLPFVCPAGAGAAPLALLLGEILKGDRTWRLSYDLRFGVDVPCIRLCDLITRETGVRKADRLIRDGYVVHWLVDGLPGATTFVLGNGDNKYYAAGFPLGFVSTDGTAYIYNHVMLVMRYHKSPFAGRFNIVGFEVYPKSVHNEVCPGTSKNYKNFALTFAKAGTPPPKTTIPYTYLVYWREDNLVDYNHRWELYYRGDALAKSQLVHWLSFVNSVVLLALVTLAVAVVLARVLRANLQRVRLDADAVDAAAAAQWRRLLGQLRQRPRLAPVLSLLVALGAQTLCVAMGVLTMFTLNSQFLLDNSPAHMFFNNHQGAFFSLTLAFFVLSSVVPSFVGVVLHKILHHDCVTDRYPARKLARLLAVYCAFLPLLIAATMLTLNLFVWAKRSSMALPFGTICVLALLFLGCLPLGVAGGYYGNRVALRLAWIRHAAPDAAADAALDAAADAAPDAAPDAASKAVRARPRARAAWLLAAPTTLLFGAIPFAIVYVELLFVFNSVWLEKTTFYFMYGFLLVTLVMLVVVVAELAVLATYVLLAVYHNPSWHWLCFRVGASLGWWIFGYLAYYFVRTLHVRDAVSVLLYFTYMTLASVLVALACGAVAVAAGLVFMGRVYAATKLD